MRLSLRTLCRSSTLRAFIAHRVCLVPLSLCVPYHFSFPFSPGWPLMMEYVFHLTAPSGQTSVRLTTPSSARWPLAAGRRVPSRPRGQDGSPDTTRHGWTHYWWRHDIRPASPCPLCSPTVQLRANTAWPDRDRPYSASLWQCNTDMHRVAHKIRDDNDGTKPVFKIISIEGWLTKVFTLSLQNALFSQKM